MARRFNRSMHHSFAIITRTYNLFFTWPLRPIVVANWEREDMLLFCSFRFLLLSEGLLSHTPCSGYPATQPELDPNPKESKWQIKEGQTLDRVGGLQKEVGSQGRSDHWVFRFNTRHWQQRLRERIESNDEIVVEFRLQFRIILLDIYIWCLCTYMNFLLYLWNRY